MSSIADNSIEMDDLIEKVCSNIDKYSKHIINQLDTYNMEMQMEQITN